MGKTFAGRITIVTILLALVSGLGCHRRPPDVRQRMLAAYGDTATLFRYVWAPDLFEDSRNEPTILASLDRLIADFHDIEALPGAPSDEPGFLVTLATHRSALNDVRRRFAAGQKEYASWRLRGLTANCVSCHSRLEVEADFIGEAPIDQERSFDGQLAAAEFLFATRQFERAGNDLFRLARTVSSAPSGAGDAVEALKLWLVIQVRVKNRPVEAAQQLEALLSERPYLANLHPEIGQWIAQLRNLPTAATGNPVRSARARISRVQGSESLAVENANIVDTLYATKLLHQYLEGGSTATKRREASYLLALAYEHIPIASFEIFREMYLEQVIREFPRTREAEMAFANLKRLVVLEHTGSGGTHLEADTAEWLEELRKLATRS